jgi:thiol-disulfide isomerase/thioredoxin
MRVETGKVRAPEIGRVCLNSAALSFRQLRGRVVLVDFWDHACVHCIRSLPYVQTWHERYGSKGLTVVGVHTPEFTFAQPESNVERGVREFGLTCPVVVDSDREIWKAFANRYWPTQYLLDKEGYLRYAHFGEGADRESAEAIPELLREVNPGLAFPPLMRPVREEDQPGAVCCRPSAELYLGHVRGRIGNEGGFKPDSIADDSPPTELLEDHCYARGRWASTVEYLESTGEGEHSILLKYAAAGVNLVMAAPRGNSREVMVRQDARPLPRSQKTVDTRFRTVSGSEESYVPGQPARMYFLVDNHDFGSHTLELSCPPGVAAFAFTFSSCVDRSRTALPTALEPQ